MSLYMCKHTQFLADVSKDVADKLALAGPVAEQCQHNMFHRERPEGEYACVFTLIFGLPILL